MNNKQRYQDTFAQVRFTGRITPEDMERKNHPHSAGRIIMLAAVVCLVAALGITAGASGIFGLQGMVLRPGQELSAGTDSRDLRQSVPPRKLMTRLIRFPSPALPEVRRSKR